MLCDAQDICEQERLIPPKMPADPPGIGGGHLWNWTEIYNAGHFGILWIKKSTPNNVRSMYKGAYWSVIYDGGVGIKTEIT